ncbi:hypothetical protein [Thermanaeromonas toyohensis]|nr:hypothetical protein [Thermanaeromonas toyohensis]
MVSSKVLQVVSIIELSKRQLINGDQRTEEAAVAHQKVLGDVGV